MLTVNQQKLKQAITDYLNSDGEKDPGLVSMGKLLLETIEEKKTYDLIRNATLKRRNVTPKRQCYNCALKEKCKKERPDTYEPIGTCDRWEDENGLRTLID